MLLSSPPPLTSSSFPLLFALFLPSICLKDERSPILLLFLLASIPIPTSPSI
ncbi:hypothetical protein OIU84_013134 [Salix udensis]|uniref:Uncharacterized protein n=1 Tax=Salix udensis TaxID=889485 RepID=A0AAD6JHA1_9ROSI|nr:hypothetical protein OIU84_013134 [Salix udensis]